MSKAPDDVDALLLHIRTLKWQAVTILASSRSRSARENAAADFAALDGLAKQLGARPGPEGIKAIKRKLESLALQRDREPASRGVGGGR